MSTRSSDPIDDFMSGVEQGRLDTAARSVDRLLTAEDIIRRQADELDQARAVIKAQRRRLVRPAARARRLALIWSLLASLLTAIAVYNLCVNGWHL